VTFSAEVLATRLAPLLGAARPVHLAVALSGGADSAALLAALATLAATDPALVLRAIHVDHGLTTAAGTLTAAARASAARAAVPLAVLAVSVTTVAAEGIEAAARRARYAALAAVLRPGECLLTAHHLEDQAETLLLQLARGAGLRGLAGMPAAAVLGPGRLLRPLLEVPRAALRAYAAAAALPFVADPMNSELRYDRAFLRARLWPALTERWPQAATTLARSAAHLAEAQRLLDGASARALAPLRRGPALEVAGLLGIAPAERGELLRFWLAEQGLRAPPARRQALIERELLRARGAGQPRMTWPGAELRVFAGFLYAFAPLAPLDLANAPVPGAGDAPLALGGLGRLEAGAALGAGLRPAGATPYRFAQRTGGERLRLGAATPRRALKDLLREARLPPWSRERALLVVGDSLAAVVLPHATWVAAEHAAAPGAPGLALTWRDAPAVLLPAPEA
jgi:tRNA(Ile)-lysidine synthase